MLMTDVGDKICWWQLWDIGDRFNTLKTPAYWESRQHNESVTNILNLSPIYCVSNINVAKLPISDDGYILAENDFFYQNFITDHVTIVVLIWVDTIDVCAKKDLNLKKMNDHANASNQNAT